MSGWDERVRQAEKAAGVWDCEHCGQYPCVCTSDEDLIYEIERDRALWLDEM